MSLFFIYSMVRAQGTIEYLIIIAIIVVIGLVVVSLMTGMLSPASGVSASINKASVWSNSIALTESSVNPDGNYLVRLANMSGEEFTITNVQVGDTNANYSEDLFQGNAQNFVVDSSDVCSTGDNVSKDVIVTYVSKHGITKKEIYPAKVFFACENYTVNLLATQCETCTTYTTRYLSPDSYTLTGGLYDTNDLRTIDTNLIAGDIRSGATIFGVSGNSNVVNTSTGTASETEIISGYVAWVAGSEITGTASAGGGDPGFGFIEFATPSYSDSGSGTVTDSANGLVWQASSYNNGGTLAWQDAMNYCNNNTAGLPGTGWRVPNMAEVGLLYNYTSWGMYGSPFTNNTSFWSSTTVPSLTSFAYYLSSSYGFVDYGGKTNASSYGVRCVRSE